MKRSILVIAGVMLLISGWLWLTRPVPQNTGTPSRRGEGEPRFAMSGMEFTAYDFRDNGAVRKSRLAGERVHLESKKIGALRFAPVKVMTINGVSMTFFDDGRPVATLTADKAVVDVPWESADLRRRPLEAIFGGRIDFRGNVQVVTPRRRSFQCGSMQLSDNQLRLSGGDHCVIRLEDRVVSAESMNTDVALLQVRWQ